MSALQQCLVFRPFAAFPPSLHDTKTMIMTVCVCVCVCVWVWVWVGWGPGGGGGSAKNKYSVRDARRGAETGALLGCRLGDGGDLQGLHPRPGVIALLFAVAAVHNEGHAIHRHTRLRDVCAEDHLPLGAAFEHPPLLCGA